MSSPYDHLDRESLVKLLQRRDADRSLGLVWEHEGGRLATDGEFAVERLRYRS